jgi:hypothetical protein
MGSLARFRFLLCDVFVLKDILHADTESSGDLERELHLQDSA